jgi:hypothetical protein
MIDAVAPAPSRVAATGRDRAATSAVLGVAGALWLTWGSQALPAAWSAPLGVLAYAGLLLGVVGGVLAWRRRETGSAMAEAEGRARYGKAVLAEVVAIVAGVAVLAAVGQAAYLPAWILLAVGVHFVPLARLFRLSVLEICGVLLVLVAAAAVVAGVTGAAVPGAIAGGMGGLLMIVFGLACLPRRT